MKKILILTPRFPYPVIGGDRLRIYYQCKELSNKYELTLLSLCESQSEMEMELPGEGVFSRVERVYLPKWKSFLNSLFALPTSKPLQVAYYESGLFRKRVTELAKEHDAVFCHLIRTGHYAEDFPNTKFLEMTDAISMNYERVRAIAKSGGFKNLVYTIEQKRLKVFEQRIAAKFDNSFLISPVDRDYLFPEGSKERMRVVICSNGVDLQGLPYEYCPNTKAIVFIGNMTTVQNFDAACWFAQHVMPKLAEHGEFLFKVVGRIKPEQKAELEKLPAVEVTGGVDNIPEAVRGAFAGVCPMRLGAGVQNKVLEYMALGLPTVSSPLGHEGINAKPGKEILLADTVNDYVQQIVALADKEYAQSISVAGRRFVEKHHDWGAMLKPMVSAFNDILK